MTPKPSLSSHLVAEATPEEISQQWVAIETRLSRRSRPRRMLPLSLALVGLASAVVILVATRLSVSNGRRPVSTDARHLLEQANAARRSGDAAQAASLFETLRMRYPRDPRAALASFELGRLRLDVLGDLPGAVQALKQSIALAPSGVFREDAEACLATAYARMRDRPRCELARRAYLDRYPEGTHATEMSTLLCR